MSRHISVVLSFSKYPPPNCQEVTKDPTIGKLLIKGAYTMIPQIKASICASHIHVERLSGIPKFTFCLLVSVSEFTHTMAPKGCYQIRLPPCFLPCFPSLNTPTVRKSPKVSETPHNQLSQQRQSHLGVLALRMTKYTHTMVPKGCYQIRLPPCFLPCFPSLNATTTRKSPEIF